MDFEFLLPTRIKVKAGLSAETGQYVKNFNLNKVLIVTDPGVQAAGILDKIYISLDEHGIEYVEYSNIKPNPRSHECEEAYEIHRDSGIQGIVAVGGGSAIDAAKAIGVLMSHGGKVANYEGESNLPNEMLPLIAIPTTSGTGSEVTFFSVITDMVRQFKMSLLNPKLGPDIALLDLNITSTLPSPIAASTGMDALTHAIESYTCKLSNPLSDAMALHAIRLINQNLIPAVQDPEAKKQRESMLVASAMAGIAFGNSDIASVHCISEAIGGMYDTPHGVGNAIFLPYVFRHNSDESPQKHADVAYALGADPSLDTKSAVAKGIERLFEMNNTLGIPTFDQLPHVNLDDFESIAKKSKANISDSSNAKPMTIESYLELLRQAYEN